MVSAESATQKHTAFGQGMSGFLLAILVHDVTGLVTAAVLWPLNPLAGVIGGVGAGVGACVVAYDVVKNPEIRLGMRTYFWSVFMLLVVGIGALAALGGLAASWVFDTPAGPSIVTAAAAVFVLTALFGRVQRRS